MVCFSSANLSHGARQEEREVLLKYQLLDPAVEFQEIVKAARCIILAGGTMSPVSSREFQPRAPLLITNFRYPKWWINFSRLSLPTDCPSSLAVTLSPAHTSRRSWSLKVQAGTTFASPMPIEPIRPWYVHNLRARILRITLYIRLEACRSGTDTL
jgi:hypothetical protein